MLFWIKLKLITGLGMPSKHKTEVDQKLTLTE